MTKPVTGVDLAAVSGAAVQLDWRREPRRMFDQTQMPESQYINSLIVCAREGPLIIEDISPGLRFDINVRRVLILQGRIKERLEIAGLLDAEWVMFTVWSYHHGRVQYRKSDPRYETTASWAKRRCEQLGFKPPPTPAGGNSKLLQDYRDAYLIARYGRDRIVSQS